MNIGWPRLGASVFFLAGGIGIGAWAASLPSLRSGFDLGEGDLGLVLLCFALGAIAAMINTGRIISRVGTVNICLVSAGLFGVMLLAAPHAPGIAALSLLVGLAGACFGTLDVTMNTEAAYLEESSGKHIMSSFHAVFSIGTFAGAAICARLLDAGAGLAACLMVTGLTVMLLAVCGKFCSGPHRRTAPKRREATSAARAGGGRRLLLLGGLSFLALFAEGAMMDWTAIYLVSVVGAAPGTAAMGFALFAGSMSVGRLIGDAATRVLGPAVLLRAGAAAVAVSFGAILLFSNGPHILVALVLSGLGIANVVPAIFSAAGRMGGADAGAAMSRVATMGYAGLLIGPPAIGFLAQATSLGQSLSTVVLAALVIAMGASLLRT